MYPAIAGYNWIQLDTAGFLDTAGYSRIQLDTAGYSWIQLDTAGYSWIQLDTAGYSWIQQDTAGYSWIQLDITGYSWIQLDTAGYSRIQLDTAGYSWIQLDMGAFWLFWGVHPSIFWSILRGNGAHTPDQDLESFKTILWSVLSVGNLLQKRAEKKRNLLEGGPKQHSREKAIVRCLPSW